MMKKSACQIKYRSIKNVRTLLWKKLSQISLVPNCPECTARAKKKILTKYEEEVEEENRDKQDLYKLFDEVEIPMEMDKNTKNFICKKCGLYASREQISDIRYKLNQKERTRDDKHDDYLEWWSKSKKEKKTINVDLTIGEERRY